MVCGGVAGEWCGVVWMLRWLVFGEDAALGRDVLGAANVNTLHVESAPRMTVIPPTASPPGVA